ncbi:metallo-beta-lactamase domain-containing protein [Hamiltosporidium magnivora]|uniref:Cleavage and polyadenylation specificity factor subunit 2 n=1 Tax=Hamiltosporidium magnivora TaxID=148818 RepID=A0A4Q9LDC4_9MICR|nr:metallo-beta-lactamase domain-containing protein [Hamiltosporidium magnivora]
MVECFINFNELVDTRTGIYAHLLEIDSQKILINCGTKTDLDSSWVDEYKDLIPSLDIIILSHLEIAYTGALPKIINSGFYGRVYSTTPIQVLGKYVFKEQNFSNSTFSTSTNQYLETDIDMAFDGIISLKYMQPVEIGSDLYISAYNSGHSIGGSIWKICKDNDTILVCIGVNHRKENHLNGLDISIQNPFLCILDTKYALKPVLNRKERNYYFFGILENAIINNKKVFIPVKYSRMPEIAFLLNEYFETKNEKPEMILYSRYATRYVEMLKTMMEWSCESNQNNFVFENIKIFSKFSLIPEQTDIYIIITENFHDGNFLLFMKLLCENDDNLLVFVDNDISVPGENLGDNILYGIKKNKKFHEKTIQLNLPTFVSLNEEELQEHIASSIKYKTEEEKSIESEEDVWEDEALPDTLRKVAWHEEKTDMWCVSGDEMFPLKMPNKPYDEYGTLVSKTEDKVFEEIKETNDKIKEEIEIIEKIVWEKTALNLNFDKIFIDFEGFSDYKSIKTVLESINPSKLVFINENDEYSNFLYHYCKYNDSFSDVFLQQNKKPINLSSESHISKINLTEDFSKINIKKIGNDFLGGFKGKIIQKDGNYYLEYIGPLENICVGNIQMNVLKRKIVENGFKVEIKGNIMIIENSIKIIKNQNTYTIEGKITNLFIKIRDMFYENIAILD